ncbi:hypothetical protein IEO21_11114 [Rhodonia placenta]|uniref:Uncharacterized protein n=1 Tax=Rhodonia placenta TaxID=104341 RepID=A0A8H7NR74_9APHY|nr:hypothetical protein IEO21_11114 [Postia placenta]
MLTRPRGPVDECGRRIIAARKKPPRPSCAPKVPAHIVDECEKSYEAADEKKVKTTNIDTPGEQQKYAITLLEHLFTFLPPNATVAALYDIGCVVDRSLELYNILPVDIHQRLIFAPFTRRPRAHRW